MDGGGGVGTLDDEVSTDPRSKGSDIELKVRLSCVDGNRKFGGYE